ncbi:MAG: hypothetical protein H0T46_20215 [Deltaproteobacteria bacterium]|nr:hypothetical protein [Deltaproteobacteria bacterium]
MHTRAILATFAALLLAVPASHAGPAPDTLQPGTNAAPAVAPPPTNPVPASPPPAPPGRSVRKLTSVITVAGGGALIATGIVFGLLARSRWTEAQDVCGGSTTCASDSDTDYAQQFADSARTRAHVSSVLVIAGGIATAVGAYLWVTSPKERAVTVSATAAPGGAGVVLGGRF